MKIHCDGTARIKHRSSEVIYTIESHELDWNVESVSERQMGPETEYLAIVDHPQLGELKWHLWEYPINAQNDDETDVGSHEIIDDFSYFLKHEKPKPDEWLEYTSPDDPFTIFMNSYRETCKLLGKNDQDNGRSLLNRMVFSHQITALEAYLADTLVNAVSTDRDTMKHLIHNDRELQKEKFTLLEIETKPELVEQTVLGYLRSILYHNLAKTNALYNLVFNIHILDLTTEKKLLFEAVMLRHDCVHRNGIDKDGNELTIFTKEFVQKTADMIMNFVNNIQNSISSF